MSIAESDVELAAIEYLEDLGWSYLEGPVLAPDGEAPERVNYSAVILEGRLRSATLTIDDKQLLDKLVPALASEEGIKPQELITTALDALAGFARAQTGETLKALDAVASFVGDWKTPAGPLVLGLKPTKTAGLDDLDKIMVPDGLSTLFGFTASYPGTRSGAARAGSKGK